MRFAKEDLPWSVPSSSNSSDDALLKKALLVLLCASTFLVFYFWRRWNTETNFRWRVKAEEVTAGLRGQLFRYGTKPPQVAFQHGQFKRVLVLIGGLGEGLLSATYAETLANALKRKQWSLVQPLFSSSYQGYGTGCLDQDAAEIKELLIYLKNERGCTEFAIVGHSTGSQDAVRFCKIYRNAKDIPEIKGIVLQAGASDQEYQEMRSETKARIIAGKQMVAEGKEEDILFRDYEWDGAPMCARRYLALAERYGDDDTFSSYFTKEDYKRLLGHMDGINCLVVFSGADQYVPKHVDKEELCKNFVEAMGSKSRYYIVQGGDHGLTGKEEEFTNLVVGFLLET